MEWFNEYSIYKTKSGEIVLSDALFEEAEEYIDCKGYTVVSNYTGEIIWIG